jgi:L-lactate dehydrogenase complex protein LldG
MSSKSEILSRIREANGGASIQDAARDGWKNVSRHYKRAGQLQPEAMLALLEARLRDYDATVIRSDRQNIAHSVAERLEARAKQRIVIPIGIPMDWLPEEFRFVVDEGLTAADLDTFDAVLTGATVAIAETGTVVLQNVPGQGRRAISLVPDYHLCIVCIEDIVETVPECCKIRRLWQRRSSPGPLQQQILR